MGEDSYLDQFYEDQYELPWYEDPYELDASWVDEPPTDTYDELDELDGSFFNGGREDRY